MKSVILAIFLCVAICAAAIVNQDVSQVIDATTAIVRYSAEIKTSDVSGEYQLVFPNSWADHLSFLSVTAKGKPLVVQSPTSNTNFTTFNVEVKGANPTLKVQAVFTSLLNPYPTEITQMESQLVKLEGSHFFYSPYPTVTQKSVYKLASATIESFSKLSPHSVRGSAVHFGPYKDIAAFEVSPLRIHFVNNHPFAKFSTMQREVEVSHWGSVAVEEIYELRHAGAELKGGFSRFDYQMRRSAPSPSFRSLVASLPAQAHNIYYRDQIGNISTSDLRLNKDGGLDLEIQTRFPIFGGWQTQFYIGYQVPTELTLFTSTESPDVYSLKCPFFTNFKDVWVEDMETKVILPEGATDIHVNVPSNVEESRSIRFTYLDSKLNGGRPVVVLKAHNLVPEHDSPIIITYKHRKSLLLVEPAMLIGAFFALFVVASLLARATGISSSRNNGKPASSDNLAASQ